MYEKNEVIGGHLRKSQIKISVYTHYALEAVLAANGLTETYEIGYSKAQALLC